MEIHAVNAKLKIAFHVILIIKNVQNVLIIMELNPKLNALFVQIGNVKIVGKIIIVAANVCKIMDSMIAMIVFNVLIKIARNATLIISLVKFAIKDFSLI